MAQYAAAFNVTLNIATGRIIITSTTPYGTYGVTPDSSFEAFVQEIRSPDGTVIYSNPFGELATPDFNEGDAQGDIVDIPTYADGSLQAGNYLVDLYIQGGGDTFVKVDSVYFGGYVEPEMTITSSYNAVSNPPVLTLDDDTEYAQENMGGATPSMSNQQYTLSYPDGIDPAPSDLVVNDSSQLQTNTFYSQQHSYQYDATITYNIAGSSGLIVIDNVTVSGTVDVIVPQDLCQVYALVEGIYQSYLSTRSQSGGGGYKERWMQAIGVMDMIRQALICGYQDNLDTYVTEIMLLANQSTATPTGTPVLITGYSATDDNTVTIAYADDNSGTNFAFTPQAGSAYIGFFSHNKNYTPVVGDYAGLWIDMNLSLIAQNAQSILDLETDVTDLEARIYTFGSDILGATSVGDLEIYEEYRVSDELGGFNITINDAANSLFSRGAKIPFHIIQLDQAISFITSGGQSLVNDSGAIPSKGTYYLTKIAENQWSLSGV